MSEAAIYVVVASNDMGPSYRAECPGRKPNPIVFESNVEGATLERAQANAANAERGGYGPCRVARLVFEDEPGFAP